MIKLTKKRYYKNMKTLKKLLPLLTLLLFSYGFISKGSIDGLKITFRDVYEDKEFLNENEITNTANGISSSGIPNNITSYPLLYTPNDGMKFVVLDMTLENTGTSDCKFDLKDIYISTEKDSLYPLLGMTGRLSTATKIKPTKKLKRSCYFEIPKNAQPNELYIEDRKIKILKENKK